VKYSKKEFIIKLKYMSGINKLKYYVETSNKFNKIWLQRLNTGYFKV